MNHHKPIIPGLLLIMAGLLIFAYQWLGWSFSWLSWPYFLMLPGVFVILLSFFNEGDTGEGLTIFGFILTTIGGILYFQYKTNLWETWAYMWALIPLSVGLAQILHSLVFPNPEKSREGFQTFRTGLILFVIFAAGFELLIFRRNPFFRSFGFAILIVLAGLLMIFKNVDTKQLPTKKVTKPNHEAPDQDTPADESKN